MSFTNGVITLANGGAAAFVIPPATILPTPDLAGDGPGISCAAGNVRVTFDGNFGTATKVTIEENIGLGGWVPHRDDSTTGLSFVADGGQVIELPAGHQIRLSITAADSATEIFYRITTRA